MAEQPEQICVRYVDEHGHASYAALPRLQPEQLPDWCETAGEVERQG